MPEGLRKYLVSNYANAGDSVLIRVIDGEAGRGEIRYESRRKRNAAAVEQRNREVADAAYQFLRTRQSINVPIWDLVIALLARGVYHSDVAPDPLETILRADPRFVSMGMLGWVLAEQMTPEVAELVERRRGIEPFRYGAPLENVPPASPAQAMTGYREEASPMPSRRAMERSMADIGAILSQQEFASIDEANAFLQNLLSTGGVPHRAAQTPLDQAQDLMYDAWEAPNPRERVRLAKQALQISPDCADAYVLLAEETTRSPKEAAALYEKAIAAGERALGKEAFAEDVGHFWGILATRPYMRARLGLAQALWAMGRRKEAISHLWDMLRLNPNDNQGVRYMLLGWLLEVGDQAEAGKLLDRYEEDYSATWLYARTLRTFRQEGSTARARALLAEAKEMNPYVPDYLLGRKRLPSRLPATIGSGDESEAIDCAVGQMIAWRTTPGALDWLAEAARSERRHGH
jgi:tetratricopeptide (TPR) repeat protein